MLGFTEIVAVLSLCIAAISLVFNGMGSKRQSDDHVVAEAERHARTDTKLDSIDSTMRGVDRKLERLDESIQKLGKDHTALEGRVTRLEARVGAIESEVQDIHEAVISEVALSEQERKKGQQ